MAASHRPLSKSESDDSQYTAVIAFLARYRILLGIFVPVCLLVVRIVLDRVYVPVGGMTASYAMNVSYVQTGIHFLILTALCWPWTGYGDALLLSVSSGSVLVVFGCLKTLLTSGWGVSTLLWYIPFMIVFAGVVFMLAPFLLMSVFIWVRRRYWPIYEDGCCFNCGYDLTGNVSGTCPECGHASEDHQGAIAKS